jgi:hypothetical protein
MTMNFSELPEFSKEFKYLHKKYLSLADDLKEFKKIISVVPIGNSKHFHVLTESDQVKIIKARLFCKYLKGSSLRIVYAYHLDLQQINFLEIYCKNDRGNEDRMRVRSYLQT